MARAEIAELAADFAYVAKKMDRGVRLYWANAMLRWNDWQDYHMPDDVQRARDMILAAMINPDGVDNPD